MINPHHYPSIGRRIKWRTADSKELFELEIKALDENGVTCHPIHPLPHDWDAVYIALNVWSYLISEGRVVL